MTYLQQWRSIGIRSEERSATQPSRQADRSRVSSRRKCSGDGVVGAIKATTPSTLPAPTLHPIPFASLPPPSPRLLLLLRRRQLIPLSARLVSSSPASPSLPNRTRRRVACCCDRKDSLTGWRSKRLELVGLRASHGSVGRVPAAAAAAAARELLLLPAELQQRLAVVAGQERQRRERRAREGRHQGQEDDAQGLPRRHHLHLRHRWSVPGSGDRRPDRAGHGERPVPRHRHRRHHRRTRLHRGRRLLHPAVAGPPLWDLEHPLCAERDLQPPDGQARPREGRPGGAAGGPEPDERGGLVTVQGVARPVRGGGHQRHAAGVHRQAPRVLDHRGVQARRRRRPLRLLGLPPGFPGWGEGAEPAGLLARVPRAVHRRLADQARVLPSLQEEALDAPTPRHGCMHACLLRVDVPCVTLLCCLG